jgi:acetone carboxylase gamma subunit
MSRRVSPTLDIRATAQGDRVCCSKCGAALVPAGRPWKPAAALDESPMKGAAGAAYSVSDKVLLRRFTCKGCGTLLDTEMALPGEPFLNDVVNA